MSLFTELRDDPANLGYAALIADKNDEGVASLLNTATVNVLGIIDRTNLTKWSVKTGMAKVIVKEAADEASLVCDSAIGIRDVMMGSSSGIDLSDIDNMDVLNGWEALGKLTAEHKALMISLATSAKPRSVALFGKLITPEEVARTARSDDGTLLIGA